MRDKGSRGRSGIFAPLPSSRETSHADSEGWAFSVLETGLPDAGQIRVSDRDCGGKLIEEILQDLKFGARMLWRGPTFTAVAVLTLALGIGANTALFSVVNGVLLNPLPFARPDQLVAVYEARLQFDRFSVTYPNFLDWLRQNHSFVDMAGHRAQGFTLTGMGEPERVKGDRISSGFFAILDVKPVAGRLFSRQDDRPGAQPVALISEGLWKRKFGSAPNAVGRSLVLDGTSHTIVGIIPSRFRLRMENFREAEVYTPIGQWTYKWFWDRATAQGMDAIARLKPGVTLQQARADMEEITKQLARDYPAADKGVGAEIIPLQRAIVEGVRPLLLLLFGAVGFVLLIACVNVANLLLARSTGRTREFAIRAALGASKLRVIRQLLIESILLAIAGGGLGILLASWGVQGALKLALKLTPDGMPRAEEVGLNNQVLLFAMGVTLLAGILFGLAPALRTSNPNLQDWLQEGGRSTTTRSGGLRAFVVAEVGISLVLLAGAGLMIRSLSNLWDVNLGFKPKQAVTFYMSLAPSMQRANENAIRAEFQHLCATIAAVPGVKAVSLLSGSFPMQGDSEDPFWIEGRPKAVSDNDRPWALWYEVDPQYLKAMGIPLLRGRFFTPADDLSSRKVAVIDSSFAERYFANEDPIGKVIVDDYVGPTVVVGVIGHVNHWGPGNEMENRLREQMYFPFAQIRVKAMATVAQEFGVAVRAAGDPLSVVTSIRHAVAQMNGQQVIYGMQTMQETISDTLAPQEFLMILLCLFAALALVLASVGIYGVVSYLAGRRTHEIGIRIALGAQQADVLRMILGEGAKMAGAGVVLGLLAALGLTRVLANTLSSAGPDYPRLLYGVSPRDPLTFAVIGAFLGAVALAACYVPARRAMRVDPIIALRHD